MKPSFLAVKIIVKVFDFKLTIDEINKLDKYSGSAYGSHPDTAEF